jgi:hypothetical protein
VFASSKKQLLRESLRQVLLICVVAPRSHLLAALLGLLFLPLLLLDESLLRVPHEVSPLISRFIDELPRWRTFDSL